MHSTDTFSACVTTVFFFFGRRLSWPLLTTLPPSPPSVSANLADAAPKESSNNTVRYAGAAVVFALGLFAVVSFQSTALPMNAVTLGQDAAPGGGLAAAEADRRTAAAAAALASQTAKNAKDAKEKADRVFAEANAEAEKLQKLAVQARKDYEIAKGDNAADGALATSGIQALEDDALAQDAKLTSVTATYEAARTTYQNSTDMIVTLTNELEAAKSATADAQSKYDSASATADAAKSTADELSKAAEDLNAQSQADKAVGEEDISAAATRADAVATAADKARAAEIVAAKAKKAAADALDALNAAKLFQKTAQESLDAENARNKVLAAQSNQAEQDMIQQSHVTALAKTAAADAKATSESGYYNSSTSTSMMEDAANKAEEKAAIAATVAATREAEAKAAAVAYQAAEDANAIAASQLALAEAQVKVEEKKIEASKNLIGGGGAPGPAASTA